MKYLFNGEEINQDELINYRPITWEDNYQTVILRELTVEEKIEQLTNWFDNTYRYKNEKYNRLIALNKLDDDGVSPETKLRELYEEAENVRQQIQELEEEVKDVNE